MTVTDRFSAGHSAVAYFLAKDERFLPWGLYGLQLKRTWAALARSKYSNRTVWAPSLKLTRALRVPRIGRQFGR